MTKKIFALILMTALMSIFVACATNTEEDEKPIALSERVGTYTGTIPKLNEDVVLEFTSNTDGTGKIEIKIDSIPFETLNIDKAKMAETGRLLMFALGGKIIGFGFYSETDAIRTTPTINYKGEDRTFDLLIK